MWYDIEFSGTFYKIINNDYLIKSRKLKSCLQYIVDYIKL